jgi:ketosteroid isomerase-like protein
LLPKDQSGKLRTFFKGRTTHDDRIDNLHEANVPTVFTSRYGCAGALKPIDGAVIARDETIQNSGNEYVEFVDISIRIRDPTYETS